jgi:mono/diheme cytochrome c family protein
MKQSLLTLGAFLFVGLRLSFSLSSTPQESNRPVQEHKVTPEDIARTNPVKPTPEGLAAARRVFAYDCAICHGALGDGKGEVVESMKLTMRDLRDPATLAGKTEGELFFIITKGKGKMPGDGDRQPEQMCWNLVNFVRSLAVKGATQKPAAAPPSS